MSPERRAALIAKYGVKPSGVDAAVLSWATGASTEQEPVTVRPYAPPSFFTALGVLSKVRQLKKKGFPPSQKNWRFLTLTFDRNRYPDPEEAYEVGKRHLRQFVYELRERGFSIPRWCWKLEFHEPDERGQVWPHFHLLLDYKRPIPAEIILACWGKGRVDVEGVTDAKFDYLMKYVAKCEKHVPHWILDRNKVRVWQTSSGFYSKVSSAGAAQSAIKASPRRPSATVARNTQNEPVSQETLGERIERWGRSCTLIYGQTKTGKPLFHAAKLRSTWGRAVVELAQKTLDRADLYRSRDGFFVSGNKLQLPSISCLNSILPLSEPFRPALS